MGRIIVGVDGSEDSKTALHWAIAESRAHGSEVVVAYVYGPSDEHNPFLAVYSTFATGTGATQSAEQAQRWQSEADEAARRHAAGELEAIVRTVTEDADDVTVKQLTVSGGRPARALLEQAASTDTIVVGARGRGGFRGLRMGSTAEKLVRHAPCSVMVARTPTS